MAKVKIQGHASGTGVITVTAPNTSTDRTITLPDSTGTLATTADTFNPDAAVTINESGADVDFRVESDNDANALFVQGSDGNVGIGISTPTNPLTVEGDGARIAFSNTATYPCLGGISAFRSGTSHGNMYIETAGGSNFNTPVERMAIEGTTGEVKISTGDLIFGTAGKGIVLGATTNVDANTLDDYEEGTWTPALRGAATAGNTTYHSQYGFYEKIGRTVHFRGSLHVNAQGTLDGIVYVTGLPFTSNSTTQRSTVHFGYVDSLSITASESLTGTVDGGDTEFLIRIWNSSLGTSNFDDSELTDGAQFYFSGTYYV
jgi:hypothetical protein